VGKAVVTADSDVKRRAANIDLQTICASQRMTLAAEAARSDGSNTPTVPQSLSWLHCSA